MFSVLYVWLWVCIYGQNGWSYEYKLDGVGPILNRPSTDNLLQFVNKQKRDMWHMTCELGHMTCDTWHKTGGGGDPSLKILALMLLQFVSVGELKIFLQRMTQTFNIY